LPILFVYATVSLEEGVWDFTSTGVKPESLLEKSGMSEIPSFFMSGINRSLEKSA
jgi:hypothetical protein